MWRIDCERKRAVRLEKQNSVRNYIILYTGLGRDIYWHRNKIFGRALGEAKINRIREQFDLAMEKTRTSKVFWLEPELHFPNAHTITRKRKMGRRLGIYVHLG